MPVETDFFKEIKQISKNKNKKGKEAKNKEEEEAKRNACEKADLLFEELKNTIRTSAHRGVSNCEFVVAEFDDNYYNQEMSFSRVEILTAELLVVKIVKIGKKFKTEVVHVTSKPWLKGGELYSEVETIVTKRLVIKVKW